MAAKYGDPDQLLTEDWVPAMPGLNLPGDYNADYAADPMDSTLTELHICDKWHPLFMNMIAPRVSSTAVTDERAGAGSSEHAR